METKYIRYCEQKEIAVHIQWLCRMGDMMPPESSAEEFISFLQLTFGKFDISLLPKAFQFWAGGNLPTIRPVKTINMFFISTLLNAYLEVNGRLIPTEPIKYLIEPKNSVKNEIDINVLVDNVKKEIKDFESEALKPIYWSRWASAFDHFAHKVNITYEQTDSVVQKMMQFDNKYYAHLKLHNNKNVSNTLLKVREDVKNSEKWKCMLDNAARFYILVKGGHV